MNLISLLELTRSRIQRLAVDELSVVLYLRLILNVPMAGLLSWLFLEGVYWLFPGWLIFPAWQATLLLAGIYYLAWLVWVMAVIRSELRGREKRELMHTPTFRMWTNVTQILAVTALARSFFNDGFIHSFVNWAMGMAWVLSCVMAGFYLVYFILLWMSGHWPSFATICAFMLAVAAACVPPENVSNESFQDY